MAARPQTTAPATAARTTAAAPAAPNRSTTAPAAAAPSSSSPASSSSAAASNAGTVGSAGAQVVPTAVGASDSTSSSSSGLPIAATAVIAIVCGLIGLFAAYKLYRWYALRQHRRQQASLVPDGPTSPPFRPQMASIGTTGPFGGSAYDPAGSVATRSIRPASTLWRQSGDFGSVHPMARPVSMASFGQLDSEGSMPNTPGFVGESPFPSSSSTFALARDHSSMSTDQLRALHAPSRQSLRLDTSGGRQSPPITTSRSSMMLLPDSSRRSLYSGPPSPGGAMSASRSSHRISGAPHAALSRVEISLPAPLAPPPGSVVQTSRATLDFAATAGIGASDSEWLEATERSVAARAESPTPHRGRAHALGHDRDSSNGSSTGPFRDPSVGTSRTGSDSGDGGVTTAPSSPLDKLQRQLAEEASKQSSLGGRLASQ